MYALRFRGLNSEWMPLSGTYERENGERMAAKLRSTLRGLEVELLPLDGLNEAGKAYLGLETERHEQAVRFA